MLMTIMGSNRSPATTHRAFPFPCLGHSFDEDVTDLIADAEDKDSTNVSVALRAMRSVICRGLRPVPSVKDKDVATVSRGL